MDRRYITNKLRIYEKLNENNDKGYILEVDVKYPKKLIKKHGMNHILI